MVMFGYQWRKTLRLCTSHASVIFKSFSSGNNKHLDSRFTVSYLMNSCGFSLEAAKSLSKKVNFSNPKKPDSVIELLKKYGFTNIQINSMVRMFPKVLLTKPDKTLLPRLEFFRSVGMSSSELSELVSSSAKIWRRSLKQQIIPCYHFLKKVLINDSMVVHVLKRSCFLHDYKLIPPNIMTLKQLGVHESSILFLLKWHPFTLCKSSVKFDEGVKKVIEMKCDPSKRGFVKALSVACGLSENSWKHKFEVYRKLGWSEDELRSTFRENPQCMSLSEENITTKMDFFVRKMGYTRAHIAKQPVFIRYSLDKRIIPRCSVLKALLMRGLIKKIPALSTFLCPSDKVFVERFVLRHCNHSAELLEIFEGKVKLFLLSFESEGISEIKPV